MLPRSGCTAVLKLRRRAGRPWQVPGLHSRGPGVALLCSVGRPLPCHHPHQAASHSPHPPTHPCSSPQAAPSPPQHLHSPSPTNTPSPLPPPHHPQTPRPAPASSGPTCASKLFHAPLSLNPRRLSITNSPLPWRLATWLELSISRLPTTDKHSLARVYAVFAFSSFPAWPILPAP